MAALNARLRVALEELLASGIRAGELPAADVAEARRLFMGLLNGLLVDQAREPESPLLDERLPDRVVAAFLDGMGAVR
jgi:hypothetical protein